MNMTQKTVFAVIITIYSLGIDKCMQFAQKLHQNSPPCHNDRKFQLGNRIFPESKKSTALIATSGLLKTGFAFFKLIYMQCIKVYKKNLRSFRFLFVSNIVRLHLEYKNSYCYLDLFYAIIMG